VKPQAVLVETNWVVDVIAPAHLQTPQAVQLLQRAREGEFELYVPAISLTEARETVRRRFAPRSRSDDMRQFLRWANAQGRVTIEDANTAFRVLDQFDGLVGNELAKIPERLDNLASDPGLKVFPLSEPMLECQVSLGAMELSLKPYDLAILGAILVKGEELRRAGHTWVGFCELDSDLQPWNSRGEPKPILSELYNNSQIWVYGDFLVEDIDTFSNNRLDN